MPEQNNREFSLLNKTNKYKIVLFLLIEISIYIIFMYLDLTDMYSYKISTALKFTGILLCWIFAVFKVIENNIGKQEKSLIHYDKVFDSRDNYILIAALFFTVISDLFLLILDVYLLGVLTFCVVQFLYLLRITRWNNTEVHNKLEQNVLVNKLIKNVFVNKVIQNVFANKLMQNVFVSALIILITSIFGFEFDLLTIVSVVYFMGISRNVIEALMIASKTRNKKHIIFAIGMLLFILCDINVGLFNIINLSIYTQNWVKEIYNFASIAMWMFYLPSQVLIALSGEV